MMDLQRVAKCLGGEVQGDKILAPGPRHSFRDRSLAVTIVDDKELGFLVHSFAGDDWMECRDYVKSKLGISKDLKDYRVRSSKPKAHPISDNTKKASDIWKSGFPIKGTQVENYIKGRKLKITDEAASVLRYHPNCPFKGKKSPALLAPMVNIATNEFQGIHRTQLNPKDKAMLGPAKDAVIKLTPDYELTNGLHICEGIETGIALLSMGFRPLWVCLSASGMANFPLIHGVECLTIFVDNDTSKAGEKAALECSLRWQAAGSEVNMIMPPKVGTDFADWAAR